MTDRNYDWWTTAIADHFFHPNYANEPVTLCADEHELAAMTGLAGREAVDQLASAVRQRVMPDYRLERILVAHRLWDRAGRSGPPPSLPLLALSTLAATQMKVGERGGGPNYYVAFRKLLDPMDVGSGMPSHYGSTMPPLWLSLRCWLEDDLAGSRGIPTITDHDHWTNIGYATQQAVFRASDRRRLFRFFHTIRLEPGVEDIVPAELRRALALWTKRQGPPGQRLNRLATDESLERYCEDLLRILAEQWDGRLRDESSGALATPIRLVYNQVERELELVAVFEGGFPESAVVHGPDSQTIELVANDGVYEPWPLPMPVTSVILQKGVELSSSSLGLFLEGAEAFAFRRAEDPLYPDWVATRRIGFGESHRLLVRSLLNSEVLVWLANERFEGEIDPAATAGLPNGWVMFRNVRIDRRPRTTPPAPIGSLLGSSGGPRMKLVGGLKITDLQRVYLAGGAPALALPVDADRSFDLTWSGERSEFKATANEFSLNAVLDLMPQPEGAYRIEHQRGTLSFDVLDGICDVPNDGVGSVVTETRSGPTVSGLLTQGPKRPAPKSIDGVSFETAILLGPAPSDVKLLARPLWVNEAAGFELSWTAVDTWIDFEPVWCVVLEKAGNIAYPVGDHLPAGPGKETQWGRLIDRTQLFEEASSSAAILWSRYLTAAWK